MELATHPAEVLGHPLGPSHAERRAGRGQGHELGGEGRRDPGPLDLSHEVPAPADEGERKPVGQGLAEDHEVRSDAPALHRTTERHPEAGLDLVEDQHRAHPAGFVAKELQPLDRREPVDHRFDDDASQLITPFLDGGPGLGRLVERDRPVQLPDGAGYPHVGARQVEPTMIPAADHPLAAGGRSGDPDGGRHGLRAGLEEADPLEPWHDLRELVGQGGFVDRRERPDPTSLHGFPRGPGYFRVSIPQRHGAQRHDEIQILTALLVPDPGPLTPDHPEVGRARGSPEERGGPLAAGRRSARDAHETSRMVPSGTAGRRSPRR